MNESTNRIGALFQALGGVAEDPIAWRNVDMLEANFPKSISELKSANDERAEIIVVDLCDQIQRSQIGTQQEKDQLIQWVDGLREQVNEQVLDGPEPAYPANRPGQMVGSPEGNQESVWPRDRGSAKTALNRRSN